MGNLTSFKVGGAFDVVDGPDVDGNVGHGVAEADETAIAAVDLDCAPAVTKIMKVVLKYTRF